MCPLVVSSFTNTAMWACETLKRTDSRSEHIKEINNNASIKNRIDFFKANGLRSKNFTVFNYYEKSINMLRVIFYPIIK